MGAYDNPQAVRIKVDLAAQNIARFNAAMSRINQATLSQKQRDQARAEREKEKEKLKQERKEERADARAGAAMKQFEKDAAIVDYIAKKDLGNLQDNALMDILITQRTKMLETLSNPDLGNAEIQQITAEYNNKVARLKKDVDTFAAGYRVYKDWREKVKDGEISPNDEDYILEHGFGKNMIQMYESVYEKKGDLAIIPNEANDGATFDVGIFEKVDDGNGNATYGEAKAVVNLSDYSDRATKDPKNPKFFEQVEIFSPAGFKSRKDFLDAGINRYKGTEYDFSRPGKIMLEKPDGTFYPKEYVNKANKGKFVESGLVLDDQKLKDFRNTKEGQMYLLEGVKGQDYQSVWVGLGKNPEDYSKDAFLDALVDNLITTYNQPTL